MTVAIQKDSNQRFVAEFERRERENLIGPAWLRPLRTAAIAHFAEEGFPTTRHEEWRYTSVAAIARTAYQLPDVPLRSVSPESVEPFAFPEPAGTRLVFVDGRYEPGLSRPARLPRGATLSDLATLLRSEPDSLRTHLARYAVMAGSPFTALNTAFFQDGALIHVPRGVVVEQPIHVLYLTAGGTGPTASHPRTLIVADEAAQVTVIESYADLGGTGDRLTNAVTEIVAGDGAVVDHYRLQLESDRTAHIGLVRTQQGAKSTITSHAITLGGGLVRNDVHAVLDGEGGNLDLNGLYIGRGARHIDNHLRVEHARPHCDSREYYKGILEDSAHGVFTGRIVVHKDAQKTDAKQTNMNLLLSADAQVDTKPQLEIFADDVKCTHGATIGQIEESELFYLRSRGLNERDARQLLIYAFASESIARVKVAPVRDALEALIFGGSSDQHRLAEADS